MYSELLNLIQTKNDLTIFRQEIDLLKASIYNENVNFDIVLNSKVRKNVVPVIIKVMTENKKDAPTFIKEIENEIKNLKTIKITLAFEPNNQNFAAIYQWFLDNLGSNIILDIYHNPNILGGIQVSNNGKYFDASLIAKVNEVIKARIANY